MNKKPLSLNMQYFADSDPAPAPAVPPVAAPAPTPVQAAPNAPTAVNVDIEQLTAQASVKAAEAAERKMEAVFKSMLQQNGMDADSINKMTVEWKAKQQTPEQAMQNLTGDNQKLTGQVQDLQRQISAIGKGIPADKAPKYLKLAESYLGEDGDFDKALSAALADFPIPAAQNPAQPAAQDPISAQQLPMGMNLFQPDGSGGASKEADPFLAGFNET